MRVLKVHPLCQGVLTGGLPNLERISQGASDGAWFAPKAERQGLPPLLALLGGLWLIPSVTPREFSAVKSSKRSTLDRSDSCAIDLCRNSTN